jgi:DNA-directed RNA polymerase subunit RPC12/RpoP
MPKTVMFKCGKCGFDFNVNGDNILNLSYLRKCPNCSEKIPEYLHNQIYQLLEALKSNSINNWDASIKSE